MRKRIFAITFALALSFAVALATFAGCGGQKTTDTTEGRPASVTAYQAVEYCKPPADKWQSNNWMIQTRELDPDGLDKEGKAKIWEVYFFSPTPEVNSQMFVQYNRGNVWPNAPGVPKGGEEGRETYRKEKPGNFRVDSPEAMTVARANGGGEYLDAHPDAKVHATLRCKADYDAINEEMPAPKYKWIWDIAYRQPGVGSDVLHVLVDAMSGDYITKTTQTPPK